MGVNFVWESCLFHLDADTYANALMRIAHVECKETAKGKLWVLDLNAYSKRFVNHHKNIPSPIQLNAA